MSKLVSDASTETVEWSPAASSVVWANSSPGNLGPAVQRVSLPNRGHALVAARSVAAGEALWTELPVAWHRAPGTGGSLDGKRAACDHCGRWFDSGGGAGSAGSGNVTMCPGACEVPFCSAACLTAANAGGHALLCAARGPVSGLTESEGADAAAAAVSALWAMEQELAADDNALFASHVGCAAKLLARAATRFLRHLQQAQRSSLAHDDVSQGSSSGSSDSRIEPLSAAALAAEATACLDVELAPWARPPWTVCTHAFRSGTLPPSPWGARASAPAQAPVAAAVAAEGSPAAAGGNKNGNKDNNDDGSDGPYSDDEPQFPDRDLMFTETLQPAYFAGALQQPRDVLASVMGASIARLWDELCDRPDHQSSLSSSPSSPSQHILTGAHVATAWVAACLNDACFDGLMGCLRTNNQAVLIADPNALVHPTSEPPPPSSSEELEPKGSSVALQGTALYAVFATMNHACEPSIRNDPLCLTPQQFVSSSPLLASETLSAELKAGQLPAAVKGLYGKDHEHEVVGVNVLAAKPHRTGDEVRACRSSVMFPRITSY